MCLYLSKLELLWRCLNFMSFFFLAPARWRPRPIPCSGPLRGLCRSIGPVGAGSGFARVYCLSSFLGSRHLRGFAWSPTPLRPDSDSLVLPRRKSGNEGPPPLAEPDPAGPPRGRASRAPVRCARRRARRCRHRRGHHSRQSRGQHPQVQSLHLSLSLSVSFFPFLSIREQPMGGCSWRRGHGTSDQDGEVVATLCGVVERVNKLVYVRTLRARYARGSALQWRTYSSANCGGIRSWIFINRANTLNCVVNLLCWI